MNPEIDLRSFRSGGVVESQAVLARPLVAPPRRILTRYLLPLILFAAFVGVSVYAARDALIPAVEVTVVQPVLAPGSTGQAESLAEAPAASEEAKEKPVQAAPAAPSAGGGAPLFQAPGWVEPDPFTTVVSALTPGTVARVHVREGERVDAGQVVAELDEGDARVALRKAEANLAVRQAEMQAAQANWENPIALQETIKTAQAEKARLEAERTKVQRQSEFSRKQADISRRLGLSGAEGTLAAEKAAVEARVAEATLKEIDAKILSQAATVEAAARKAELRLEDKAALSLAKAQVEEAIAAVEETRLRLSRCRVTAPTSGTVMRLHATPGSMISMDVQHGTQIVSMYDPQQLQVRAEVPLAEAGKIQIGLPAEIRVEAMPDRVFHGELTRIVHEADVQRNSLPVKVRVLDPDPKLKPEMVARLQFKSMPKPEAPRNDDQVQKPETTEPESLETPATGEGLFIPGSLVPPDAKSDTLLWVVGPDMRAHQKKITLGQGSRGELREVAAGLQPSDKLIASNIEKLKEGGRVRIAAMDHERKQ